MKKILIFCFIIAAVYFGWRYAPENMKNKIRDGFDYIGLSKITATTFTKPIAWLKDKTMPENPVLSRALLIDQLAEKLDKKSTRLNSSHSSISYAVFCLKKEGT